MSEERTEKEQKEYEDGLLGAIDDGIGNADRPLVSKPAPGIDPDKDSDPDPNKDPEADPAPDIDPDKDPDADPNKDQDPDKDPGKDSDKDPDPDKDPDSKPDPDVDPKDKTSAGETKPEGEAETLPAKTGADGGSPADPDKKPSDQFGDLPEGTKKETTERFQSMKVKFDDQAGELDRVTKQNTDWMETIQATQATPEQFGMALSYIQDINSGTPESLERAYETMNSELKVLAQLLGKEAPGVDPLDAHPDLKKKVDDGFIDKTDAMEIASARAQLNLNKQNEINAGRKTDDNVAYQTGLEDIRVLGQELNASDPVAFKAKYPFLKSIIKAVVSSGAKPASWASSIKTAFNEMEIPVQSAPGKPQKAVNPMRPSGTGGHSGSEKEPGSVLEAVNQALGLSN